MTTIPKGGYVNAYNNTNKSRRKDLKNTYIRSGWEANIWRYFKYVKKNKIPYMVFPEEFDEDSNDLERVIREDKRVKGEKSRNHVVTINGTPGKGRILKKIEYEPETLWFDGIKRGVVSYKPDFRLTFDDKFVLWIEVKGYLDPKGATKIRRFKKYFPEYEIDLIRKREYFRIKRNFRTLIKHWEK